MTDTPVSEGLSDEIVFGVEGDDLFDSDVMTKVEAVESLSSFNVGCVTGTVGSAETEVWNAEFKQDGSTPNYKGKNGAKYWPSTDALYKFFASNVDMTHHSSGYTVSASNTKDVVCAVKTDPTYKSSNKLTFNHIFARLGDVEVNAASGYTISAVSINITPKTGGTYSLVTGNGMTDGTGWSSISNGSATQIANATPGTKSNDIYLVPGSYTLTATWTATNGNYTQTFTGKTQNVSLVGGKVNKIRTTLGGQAEEIVFTVELTPWGETTLEPTFPMN